VALSAVVFLVIGNPASGNGTAPELLPGFWRWISQLMPAGAGGTGVRNISYFDGHALTRPLLVLVAYAALGAALVLGADAIRRLAVRTGSHGPTDAERSEAHQNQTHAALKAA
jgi:prepilin-type processing-associated H-X9-DG protein